MATVEKINDRTIKDAGFTEDKIRDLLAERITDFLPDRKLLTITTEFSSWEDSKRKLDILALDDEQNLVVIELKRDSDSAHAELQALRYAAMLSVCSVNDLVEQGVKYRKAHGMNVTNEDVINEYKNFLKVANLGDVEFGAVPKIILVSSGFNKEITTTVMWLNENFGSLSSTQNKMDISCFEVKLYEIEAHYGLYFDQIIPITQAKEYFVKQRQLHSLEEKKKETLKKAARTWKILEQQAKLKKGDSLTLIKLFQYMPESVDPMVKMATYMGDGALQWEFDKKTYNSFNELSQKILKEYAKGPQTIQSTKFWGKSGTDTSLYQLTGEMDDLGTFESVE